MGEATIVAENVGVKFVRSRRRNTKLRDYFVQGGKRRLKVDEFWALRDLSFTINAGEAVGIIGRNGTGKSTLLKIVAGVLIPDEGASTRTGGWRRCWSSAPVLQRPHRPGERPARRRAARHEPRGDAGQARRDHRVRRRPGGRRDRHPVRHYSSGMRVRLGFAVIAQLTHPILLVDEVLAVGDKEFRNKCYKTIEQMLSEGRTCSSSRTTRAT